MCVCDGEGRERWFPNDAHDFLHVVHIARIDKATVSALRSGQVAADDKGWFNNQHRHKQLT